MYYTCICIAAVILRMRHWCGSNYNVEFINLENHWFRNMFRRKENNEKI